MKNVENGLSAFQKLFHSWNLNPFSTFLIESWHFEVHSRRFYMFLNWFVRISFVIKKNKIELISILIFWSKSLGREILGRDPSFFFQFQTFVNQNSDFGLKFRTFLFNVYFNKTINQTNSGQLRENRTLIVRTLSVFRFGVSKPGQIWKIRTSGDPWLWAVKKLWSKFEISI